MLHTVNKSPFQTRTLESCLRHALPGSAVLLIEDGVYAAMQGTPIADKVRAAMEQVRFYVLGPDLEARGMDGDKVIEGIEIVDYGGFVDLTIEYGTVQSWL